MGSLLESLTRRSDAWAGISTCAKGLWWMSDDSPRSWTLLLSIPKNFNLCRKLSSLLRPQTTKVQKEQFLWHVFSFQNNFWENQNARDYSLSVVIYMSCLIQLDFTLGAMSFQDLALTHCHYNSKNLVRQFSVREVLWEHSYQCIFMTHILSNFDSLYR